MSTLSSILLFAAAAILFLSFGAFALASARERERRATVVAVGAALLSAVVLVTRGFAPTPAREVAAVVLLAVVGVLGVLFLWPIGRTERGDDVPTARVDERDIMFARARLEPGSPEHAAYYAMRPENKPGDDRTRSLAGLGSPKALKAELFAFATMGASFSLTEALYDDVDGPVAPDRVDIPPARITAYLKDVARYWGAHRVGVAELKPYHVYSHVGRGSGVYGEPITLDHQYAVAFSVEMNFEMMGSAPDAPVVMESARQYVEAAKVAVQVAALIRSLGYRARAHIDGNYRVIAPIVARDAGLGEIGRMGLLMTPDLGPRVRLGVVTTELPLEPDGRAGDLSALDFCRICEKCAENCPSSSIPTGDRRMVDGALRWRINPDTCFRYWNSIGTDCGRCMTVCPYSHPDTAMHDVVRWANRRSGFARRATLWLDDAVYGRRPAPRPGPDWVPPRA